MRFRIWYSARPKALRFLLTVNVCMYLLWILALVHFAYTKALVEEHLAFHAAWPVFLFEPWQLITYSFLHLSPGLGGLVHVAFNLLWLYWLGQDVEEMYGSHTLFSLYLYAAAGGALLSAGVYNIVGTPQVLIHGASGSVLGVITALAFWQPYKRIRLWLIGSLRIIHLVIAFLVLDLLTMYGSTTAIFAHVGGALTGFLFVRAGDAGVDLSSWAKRFFQPPSRRPNRSFLAKLERRLSREPRQEGSAYQHSDTFSAHRKPTDFSERELDRVLDKINDEGLGALTPEERSVLESFSRSR